MARDPLTNGSADALPKAKPAFLRRVRIRGYKSIEFCDVTLEPLTILVGRNASGKSNFLDALGFLSDLMEMRIPEAVSRHGGWRSIKSRFENIDLIEIMVESQFESIGSPWSANYSLSMESTIKNEVKIRSEILELREVETGRECGFNVSGGKVTWTGEEHFENDSEWTSTVDVAELASSDKLDDPRFMKHQSSRLFLSVSGTLPFCEFSEGLRSSRVYNFQPQSIRNHQPINSESILARDGSNIAHIMDEIKTIDNSSFRRVRDYLASVVPGVSDCLRKVYGDSETIAFVVEQQQGQLVFDASSMSDGTLRTLAALLAANQIILPLEYPGFIAIEEPETSLHPAATRALVDALDEATMRTQILLTTHSADILDNPTILPENIRVVRMIEGRTVIAPVDEASVSIVRQNLNTLGELERQDRLEPDADDLERQRSIFRNGVGQS